MTGGHLALAPCRAPPPYITGRWKPLPLTLSPSAAARVAAIAARQGKPAILRLAVEGGGCSGFQYTFGLADGTEADDVISTTDEVQLVVDPVSLDLVGGLHGRFRRVAWRRGVPGRESQRHRGLWLRIQLRHLIGR